jgi:hypothetical protein
MGLNIIYGEGGFCENCDNTHKHPLHNIVEQYEVKDNTEQDQRNALKQSAKNKLTALGLSEDEIQALLG